MALFLKKLTNILRWSNQPNKIPHRHWPYLFQTMGELIDNGFSLHQILTFMGILLPKYRQLFEKVDDSLSQGQSLENAMLQLGFDDSLMAQIFNAQKQGQLAHGFLRIGQELDELMTFRKSLIKVLIYPVFLITFLTCVMFGVRYFMLEQITGFVTQETYDQYIWVRVLIQFFVYLPQIVMVFVATILIIVALYQGYLRRFSMLDRYRILVKLPICKTLIKKYCSYKVARDIGHFYGAGYSIQQTISYLLKYPIDPLMTSIAQQMYDGYLHGKPLDSQLEHMAIFTQEFPLIIKQGELTSQLAQQCHIYSKKIFREFIEEIMQKVAMIQPILFLGVAMIILAIYLLMMMPMLTMSGISM